MRDKHLFSRRRFFGLASITVLGLLSKRLYAQLIPPMFWRQQSVTAGPAAETGAIAGAPICFGSIAG